MLFSSSNLFGELGTTYGSPDLGSHNTKYKIIISSQEFYRHYFYCLVTCKASLGSPFAKQAGMQLSEVLVLVHVLLISVNPLHTVPSGFFLMHGTDWMKAVSLKQHSAAVWAAQQTATHHHTHSLMIPNWESKAPFNSHFTVWFWGNCLQLNLSSLIIQHRLSFMLSAQGKWGRLYASKRFCCALFNSPRRLWP